MLAPFAPHVSEELWERLGGTDSVFHEPWPVADRKAMEVKEVEIAVQINGKVKTTTKIPVDIEKEEAIRIAKESLADKLPENIVKEIYVPGKIVNLVVKS